MEVWLLDGNIMPCYHNEPEPTEAELAKARRLRNAETRLAYDRCRSFEAAGFVVPEWAQEWWLEHRKEDDKRVAKRPQSLKELQARVDLISSLSQEDLKLIGLL
jgi:hypothetical protein